MKYDPALRQVKQVGLGISGAIHEVLADPNRETELKTIQQNGYTIHYLYSRSSEAQKTASIGQDAMRIRYGRNRVAFAVCDGVGQSFNGHIAAQFLGEKLVDWLWKEAAKLSPDVQALQIKLRKYLNQITQEAQRMVDKYPLPSEASSIVKDVLNELRAEGSETTFSCGFIGMPTPLHPDGLVLLAWMGDSPMDVWNSDGQRLDELGRRFVKGQHWSTQTGLSERTPHIWISSVSQTSRLVAYSDGFLPISNKFDDISTGVNLDEEVKALAESGSADDVSLIEIKFEQPSPSTLPPPVVHRIDVDSRQLQLEWLPIRNATGYHISCSINGKEKFVGEITENRWIVQRIHLWKQIKIELRACYGAVVSLPSDIALYNRNGDTLKILVAIIVLVISVLVAYFLTRR